MKTKMLKEIFESRQEVILRDAFCPMGTRLVNSL